MLSSAVLYQQECITLGIPLRERKKKTTTAEGLALFSNREVQRPSAGVSLQSSQKITLERRGLDPKIQRCGGQPEKGGGKEREKVEKEKWVWEKNQLGKKKGRGKKELMDRNYLSVIPLSLTIPPVMPPVPILPPRFSHLFHPHLSSALSPPSLTAYLSSYRGNCGWDNRIL